MTNKSSKLGKKQKRLVQLQLPVSAAYGTSGGIVVWSHKDSIDLPIIGIRIDERTVIAKIEPTGYPVLGYGQTKASKKIKNLIGRATCSSADEFDFDFGFDLAASRLISEIYAVFITAIDYSVDRLLLSRERLSQKNTKAREQRRRLFSKAGCFRSHKPIAIQYGL